MTLWFSAWSPRSKTTGLGATPAEAFEIATGVDLLDVMRLGARIVERSTNTRSSPVHSRSTTRRRRPPRVPSTLLFANMASPLDDLQGRATGRSGQGAIGRSALYPHAIPIPCPIDDNTIVMLRHPMGD